MISTHEETYISIDDALDALAGLDLPAASKALPWPEVTQARKLQERADEIHSEAMEAYAKAQEQAQKAVSAWATGKGKLDTVVQARGRAQALDMSRTVTGGRVTSGKFRELVREENANLYKQAIEALRSIGEEAWVPWLDNLVQELTQRIIENAPKGMVNELRFSDYGNQVHDDELNDMYLRAFPNIQHDFEQIQIVWNAAEALRNGDVLPGKINSSARVGALPADLARTLPFQWESLDGIFSDYRYRFIRPGRLDEFLACVLVRKQRPGVYSAEHAHKLTHNEKAKGWGGDWADEHNPQGPKAPLTLQEINAGPGTWVG